MTDDVSTYHVIYQRLEDFAIQYQGKNNWEDRNHVDQQTKNYIQGINPERYSKFWTYYCIRKED